MAFALGDRGVVDLPALAPIRVRREQRGEGFESVAVACATKAPKRWNSSKPAAYSSTKNRFVRATWHVLLDQAPRPLVLVLAEIETEVCVEVDLAGNHVAKELHAVAPSPRSIAVTTGT